MTRGDRRTAEDRKGFYSRYVLVQGLGEGCKLCGNVTVLYSTVQYCGEKVTFLGIEMEKQYLLYRVLCNDVDRVA